MDYIKNILLNIYGIEGLFITAFILVLALSIALKTMITKKKGWDFISFSVVFIVALLFFGIYINYEDEYNTYKAKQKTQWEEKTKNWTAEDWQNYESQVRDEDYQCGGYCHNE